MAKIVQMLLRTEQNMISSPLKRKIQSKAKDEDARRDEDESIDAIFKAEVASFVKCNETYKSNKGKAYTTLWKQCQLSLGKRFRISIMLILKLRSIR